MTTLNDVINLTIKEKKALSKTKTFSYTEASGIIFTDNQICLYCGEY